MKAKQAQKLNKSHGIHIPAEDARRDLSSFKQYQAFL